MLKAFVFVFIFTVALPAGILVVRAMPRLRLPIFILMLWILCCARWTWLGINLISIPDWTGTARGYALWIYDLMSLVLLGSMIGAPGFRIRLFPPGWWLGGLVLLSGLISIINAKFVMQWGFEFVKLCWGYLYFLTVYNYLVNTRNFWPVIYAILGSAYFMFLIGFYQKYLIWGFFQVPNTFPHQNSAALFMILWGCIVLGVAMCEKMSRPMLFALLGALGCFVVLMIFTLSRGGLVIFLFSLGMTMLLSLLFHGFSTRKTSLILVMLLAGMLFSVKAMPVIIERFLYAPESSKLTRVNLAIAACRIADDYTLGVGLNNFSWYTSPFRDYAREHFPNAGENGVAGYGETGPIVETVYLLVAAECGWIGLVILLLWMLWYWGLAFRAMVRLRRQPGVGLAIGILGGLTGCYIQSIGEWVLKQYANYYQLLAVFAIVAALTTLLREQKGRENQSRLSRP